MLLAHSPSPGCQSGTQFFTRVSVWHTVLHQGVSLFAVCFRFRRTKEKRQSFQRDYRKYLKIGSDNVLWIDI